MMRLDFQGPMIAGDRGVEAPQSDEQNTAVEQRIGEVRVQRQSLVIAFEGFVRTIELLQRNAAIVPRAGIVRPHSECLVVGVEGFGIPFELVQHRAEVGECGCGLWISPEHRTDQLQCLLIAALLVSDHPEQMHRIKITRLRLQYRQINRLGFLEAASLVKRNCPVDQRRWIRILWAQDFRRVFQQTRVDGCKLNVEHRTLLSVTQADTLSRYWPQPKQILPRQLAREDKSYRKSGRRSPSRAGKLMLLIPQRVGIRENIARDGTVV